MTRHAIIYSVGRSGTNRLLDIVDQHPWTHCRNELNRHDPDLNDLWDRDFRTLSVGDFDHRWARVIEHARIEQGADDRLHYRRKAYLRPAPFWAWSQVVRRGKLRRLVGMRSKRWRMPTVCFRPNTQSGIFPVIKLGGRSGSLVRHHPRLTDQYIILTMRRPDTFLQSWFNRHVKVQNRPYGDLQNDTRAYLEPDMTPEDFAALPRDDTLESLVRLELLKWRAQHEPVLEKLSQSPRLLTVTFESINADPQAEAKRIFDFLGLDTTQESVDRISSLQNTLFNAPHTEKLPQDMLDRLIPETLGGSVLLSLWPELATLATRPTRPHDTTTTVREV